MVMLFVTPSPGRAGSLARELESPVEPQKALDLLLKEMTQFYRTLAMFGTDPELITQVFRQVRGSISAWVTFARHRNPSYPVLPVSVYLLLCIYLFVVCRASAQPWPALSPDLHVSNFSFKWTLPPSTVV